MEIFQITVQLTVLEAIALIISIGFQLAITKDQPVCPSRASPHTKNNLHINCLLPVTQNRQYLKERITQSLPMDTILMLLITSISTK